MTDDEREHQCAELSTAAVNWIVGQLAGIQGVGFRNTSGLENEIYGWLWEHALFDDET